jgi:hypothetical protein
MWSKQLQLAMPQICFVLDLIENSFTPQLTKNKTKQNKHGDRRYVAWNSNSTVVPASNANNVEFYVAEVKLLVMETCYVTSSSVSNVVFAAKVFNKVECIDWDVDVSLSSGGSGSLGESAIPITAPTVTNASGAAVDVCSFEIADPPDGITTGSPTMKILVEEGKIRLVFFSSFLVCCLLFLGSGFGCWLFFLSFLKKNIQGTISYLSSPVTFIRLRVQQMNHF